MVGWVKTAEQQRHRSTERQNLRELVVYLKRTSPLLGAQRERSVAVATLRVGRGKRFEVSWRRGEGGEIVVVGAKTALG